jgi:hypothetical protein
MTPVEYAAGDDPGPNPLRMRGMFPPHWGEAPDSPEALHCWIAGHALTDGARSGHADPLRLFLEHRRQDPEAVREEARTVAAHRLRREQLARLLREQP